MARREESKKNRRTTPANAAIDSGVEIEFLARFLADQEDGHRRPLEEYLRLYPGAQRAVVREFFDVDMESSEASVSVTSRSGDETHTVEVPLRTADERYEVRSLLGVGGMGEVYLARDRTLDRDVAVKYSRDKAVRSEAERAALAHEALVAARLVHPNIPPVHDLGVDGDGRLFYVMRNIRGIDLKEILARRSRGGRDWSLQRLLVLFQQACLAMDYAHSREVVHLDLKPANIMTGSFGELYIVDWGLSSDVEAQARSSTPRSDLTSIRGTPAYMSPEQARGRRELTPASDIFSLGAILYEIVTGGRAFPDAQPTRLLEDVRDARFDRGAAFDAAPEDLREICERALARRPEERHATARAIADDVQRHLDGTRERERNEQAATAALRSADAQLAQERSSRREVRRLERQVRVERPESWAPETSKRAYWELEDELEATRDNADRAGEEAMLHLVEAYRHTPDDERVRERLGRLYWERFIEAEERKDRFQQRFLEDQLRALQLPRYDAALRGEGSLEIHCSPAPQKAVLRRFVERNRVLRPLGPRVLDPKSLRVDPLLMGSWQLTLERRGYRPIVAPVAIGRGENVILQWRLRREEEIGDDFLQVPPGPFVMGGDRDTTASAPRSRPFVKEFCVARHPVTLEEYLEFLEHLHVTAPKKVRTRMPRPSADSNDPYGWISVEDGVRLVRRRRSLKHRRWPVFGISWHDAMAYARWRSKRDGRSYTLASDEEWEKAARGVDGRLFPWGDRFDASFCKNLHSKSEKSQPEPVGLYRRDRSPYGVEDMAGGIKEWCRSWFSKRDDQRLVRGGSWTQGERSCHCALRNGLPPEQVQRFIGFRLVHHYK